jgi:pimeloyl-ACP methyl ester carboxylesterase
MGARTAEALAVLAPGRVDSLVLGGVPCRLEVVPGDHALAFRQSENVLPLVLSHLEAAASSPADAPLPRDVPGN